MFKLAALALAATAAQVQGQVLLNGAAQPYTAGYPYAAGYPIAAAPALQYAPALNALNVAGPVAYAQPAFAAPVLAAAPAVAYAHAAPVAIAPRQYNVPAPRTYAEAPIVEQTVEKVEQHGYSVRY